MCPLFFQLKGNITNFTHEELFTSHEENYCEEMFANVFCGSEGAL